jgi:hypothetical protein
MQAYATNHIAAWLHDVARHLFQQSAILPDKHFTGGEVMLFPQMPDEIAHVPARLKMKLS